MVVDSFALFNVPLTKKPYYWVYLSLQSYFISWTGPERFESSRGIICVVLVITGRWRLLRKENRVRNTNYEQGER